MQILKPSPIALQHQVVVKPGNLFVVALKAQVACFLDEGKWCVLEEPQIPALWQAGELMPSLPPIVVPRFVIRCFISLVGRYFREVVLELEQSTTFFKKQLVMLSYQAHIPVKNILGEPISHYFFALDHIDHPRKKRYYYHQFKLRLGEHRAEHWLDDGPLLPSKIAIATPKLTLKPVFSDQAALNLAKGKSQLAMRQGVNINMPAPQPSDQAQVSGSVAEIVKQALQKQQALKSRAKRQLGQLKQGHSLVKSQRVQCVITEAEVVIEAGNGLSGLADCVVANVSFVGRRFAKSRFKEVIFKGCDFTGAVFEEAEFTEVQFVEVKLSGVYFEKTHFTDCLWQSSDARFSRWRECTFERVHFYAIRFAHSTWQEGLLNTVTWHAVVARGVLMAKMQCQKAVMRDSLLCYAVIERAGFHDFTLSRVRAMEAYVSQCGWFSSKLSEVDFTQAKILTCHFATVRMRKLCFVNCRLTHSSFEDVMLVRSHFRRSDLSHTRWIKAVFISSSVYQSYGPRSIWLHVSAVRLCCGGNYWFQIMKEYCDEEFFK